MNDPELKAWADRMHDALETILEGLRPLVDEDMAIDMSPEDIVRIARRALNPDEWERVS